MTSVTQSIAIIAATVLASLLLMAVLNRFWPREQRRSYNDLIGWQLGIIGTTYAVILGFMLYAVWAKFGEAELNVDAEANAIVDIYRLAGGLPEPQRTHLQQLAREYVDSVIAEEWPQMTRGEMPEENTATLKQMWDVLLSVKSASPSEVNQQELATSELEALGQRRLTRIRQGQSRLPNLLWWLLLVGGALSIICSCTLGSDNVKLQSLEVFCFSLLISLSLVSIAQIHRPFRGLVHVSSYAFQRTQQSMQSRSQTH